MTTQTLLTNDIPTGPLDPPPHPPSYAIATSEAGSSSPRERHVPDTFDDLEPLPAYPLDGPSSSAALSIQQKPTFGERFHRLSTKAGRPFNKAANFIGAEGIYPSTLDKECLKAARVLFSFTKLADEHQPAKTDGPKHRTALTKKALRKIPPKVLSSCAGLAIFNVLRAGAHFGSLSGGSGLVLARRPDGSWSPPSSFIVSSLGAGFVFGLDLYDCVCVLNTPAQVAAFMNPRVALGGGLGVTVGPVGSGHSVDAAVSKTARPTYSYIKSRGLWAGIQIDGTVMVTRADANAVFYNERGISAKRILTEDVPWPSAATPLREVLSALEGRRDLDSMIFEEVAVPPPGDDDHLSDVVTEKEQLADMRQSQIERESMSSRSSAEGREEGMGAHPTAAEEKERLAHSGY